MTVTIFTSFTEHKMAADIRYYVIMFSVGRKKKSSQLAYLAHLIGPIKTRQSSHSQPLNFPLLVLYSFSEPRWEHRYKTDLLKRFFKVSCPYLQTLQSVCIHLF